jgi:CrcB protein
MMIREFIWVAIGGAAGSVLRYGFSFFNRSDSFPFSTLTINVIGSFLLGAIIAYTDKNPSGFPWKQLLGIGLCGGFTTFSAFSMESLTLLKQQQYHLLIAYVFASFTLGIGGAWIGYQLCR